MKPCTVLLFFGLLLALAVTLSDGWTESEKSTVKIEMRKVKGGHKGISFLKSMGSKKKKATTKKPVTKSKKTQGSNKPPSADSGQKPKISNCEKAKLLKLTKTKSGGYLYFETNPKPNWDPKEAKDFCQKNGMNVPIFEPAEKLKDAAEVNQIKDGMFWAARSAEDSSSCKCIVSDLKAVMCAECDMKLPYLMCELAKNDQKCF